MMMLMANRATPSRSRPIPMRSMNRLVAPLARPIRVGASPRRSAMRALPAVMVTASPTITSTTAHRVTPRGYRSSQVQCRRQLRGPAAGQNGDDEEGDGRAGHLHGEAHRALEALRQREEEGHGDATDDAADVGPVVDPRCQEPIHQ